MAANASSDADTPSDSRGDAKGSVVSSPSVPPAENAGRLFAGDGEMAHLMRAMDWAQTGLGAPETWSASLRMMVDLLLANRFPLLLWWGPEFYQLYNDAYRPVLGTKHPRSLVQPASQCFPEIWNVIGPLIETPFSGGPATWSDDLFLEVYRHGFLEETHFTVAYSPVPDESAPNGIGGVLATVHEISEQVVGERRVELLRDLGTRAAEAKTAEEACRIAAETLAHHAKDIPFALLYVIDADGKHARLAASTGVVAGEPISPEVIALESEPSGAKGVRTGAEPAWPLDAVVHGERAQEVEDLSARFEAVPPGPWADVPRTAVVLPIRSNIAHQPAGVLVAGVSARLRFDDAYAGFLELVSGQIATAIATARAYEEERHRAEVLAALDRAKTTFFSNVSHEFRTPLTLMLGPAADSLEDARQPLPPDQRERMEVIQRNGLRLLKLVNTLLDFSRIEAGRIQASFEPTDLATFTAELASAFRSLVESAGMRLVVECSPLPEPVSVDRDMWEKIVLNLLSNAFKFTQQGTITVALHLTPLADETGGTGPASTATGEGGHVGARHASPAGGAEMVELEVRDTGVGIPAGELPHIFERFHRVEGVRARTHEGSGIGLALVQELVQLHGGTIQAQSREGEGTCFIVRIPLGASHLPPEAISATRTQASTQASTALDTAAFVEEAERWLPNATWAGVSAAMSTTILSGRERDDQSDRRTQDEADREDAADRARIVLADDNADMREYLLRLLGERYRVEAVGNGQAALAAIERERPDLVLADVMMPELDGFGLLRALRANPQTANLPIMLLSARAGEEATIEGLAAGADDYLIKPFSAREVLSRIAARLEIAQIRQEAFDRARQLEATFEAMADAVFVYDHEGRIVRTNTAARTLFELDTLPGYEIDGPHERASHVEARDEEGRLIPVEESGLARLLRGEVLTGANALDVRVRLASGRELQVNITGAPLRDAAGNTIGAIAISRDVTERRQLERAARASEERLRAILDLLPVGVAVVDATGTPVIVNQQVRAIWAADVPLSRGPANFGRYTAWWPGTGRRLAPDEWGIARALASGEGTQGVEVEIEAFDGKRKTILSSDAPLRDETGVIAGGMSVIMDITERKQLERRTHDVLEALLAMAEVMVGTERTVASLAEVRDRPIDGRLDDQQALTLTVERLASLCCRVLNSERVAIIGLDPDTELLRPIALTGASPDQDKHWRSGVMRIRLTERFGAEMSARLRAGESVLIEMDNLSADDPARILSDRRFLLVPMLAGGVLAGYFGVNFGDRRADYSGEGIARAEAVARLVGLVVERERLTREREQAQASESLLRETTRRMDEFLGIASHELRTPLTSITANVQMAERLLRPSGKDAVDETQESRHDASQRAMRERAHTLLERTERQVVRLDRLVGDLLDVSRIQADKLELRRERVDLAAIVREAAEAQRAVWPERSVTLDLPRAAEGTRVLADADRIGQVVTNYLTNALKYSSAQQPVDVRVRVERANPTLPSPAREEAGGGVVRVEVADHGPGLAPEQREHLFERFYRVPGIGQQSGSGVGLGLGLHICKTIVERHGGRVGVESAPGAGSTFWFTLPLAA